MTESAREILGIVFCPGCAQDTMPDERTGLCFFCDRPLVAVAAQKTFLLREREAA